MKFAEKGVVDETLVRIIRGNVREPDQLIGDIYALATCNEIGHRRLSDMMAEFDLSDLEGIAAFILDNSRRATIERIAALPQQSASGEMTIDGFEQPITLKVKISVEGDRIVFRLHRHLRPGQEGHQLPAGLYQGPMPAMR